MGGCGNPPKSFAEVRGMLPVTWDPRSLPVPLPISPARGETRPHTHTRTNAYTHTRLSIQQSVCSHPHTAQLGSWEGEEELLQGVTTTLSAPFLKPATQRGREILLCVAGAGTRTFAFRCSESLRPFLK